jgi:F-type H+-transporting ATPase subunit b
MPKLLKRVLILALLLLIVVIPVLAEEEAAASVSPLDPLGINGGLLFTQIFNFLLIFVLLTAILWKPAVNMLDKRSATIQKGLEDAAEAAKARQNAEQEAAKILTDARAEAAKVLEEARGRGDELAKSIESGAKTDAEKLVSSARSEAQSARDSELAGVRDQVVAISVAVAGRLLGENLDAKKQKELINKFFTELPADAKSLGDNLEVISAMPLEDSEQAKIKKELNANNVTFLVNPSILGGVVVRSGDRVVDGSVRSGLNKISGSLN